MESAKLSASSVLQSSYPVHTYSLQCKFYISIETSYISSLVNWVYPSSSSPSFSKFTSQVDHLSNTVFSEKNWAVNCWCILIGEFTIPRWQALEPWHFNPLVHHLNCTIKNVASLVEDTLHLKSCCHDNASVRIDTLTNAWHTANSKSTNRIILNQAPQRRRLSSFREFGDDCDGRLSSSRRLEAPIWNQYYWSNRLFWIEPYRSTSNGIISMSHTIAAKMNTQALEAVKVAGRNFDWKFSFNSIVLKQLCEKKISRKKFKIFTNFEHV